MSNESQWRSVVDLIIPHPTEPQILMQQRSDQWHLPTAPIEDVWSNPIGRINEEVERQFGIKTSVVRQISECRDEAQHLIYHIYLLENHTPDSVLPEMFRWVSASELGSLTLIHPPQEHDLQRCLDELDSGIIPPQRALWERPGWFHQAESWICRQLIHLGNPPTGAVEQVKLWFLSCILRAPTEQGWVYFKATNGSPLMVNEAMLTQTLAHRFPLVMPQPLAIDPSCDWLLLADFGPELGWDAAVETREAALVAFAHLQIASAPQVDELLAHGCIDRRLSKLAEQIGPLFTDPALMAMIDGEQQ